MNFRTIKVNALPARLKAAVQRVSRRHDAYVEQSDVVALGSGWDGGSRSLFGEVTESGSIRDLASNGDSAFAFSGKVTPQHAVLEGYPVIEWGTSCGKPSRAHIHLCAADWARFNAEVKP